VRFNQLRAPPDDTMTGWDATFFGGPTVPQFAVPCRTVPVNNIVDLDFTLSQIWGYATVDPPNPVSAGVSSTGALRTLSLIYAFSSPLSFASIPGFFFFPVFVEEVTTSTDHYFRIWLIDITAIP